MDIKVEREAWERGREDVGDEDVENKKKSFSESEVQGEEAFVGVEEEDDDDE